MQLLPYAALEPISLQKYVQQGLDFLAFCEARQLSATPANFASLTGYFTDYFLRGNTTRTYSTLTTRLKWFFEHVLQERWLDDVDTMGHRRFLQVRRALCKLDDTAQRKARPLYMRILKMALNALRPTELEEFQVLAAFTLAHAAIQRLGELVNGVAKLSNLKCYQTPSGAFFAFFYLRSNKPKNYKIGQAPFAMISEKGNSFAFNVIRTYLLRIFGGYVLWIDGKEIYIGGNSGLYDIDTKYRYKTKRNSAGGGDSIIDSDTLGLRNHDVCLFPRLDGRHMRSRVGLSKSRAVSLLRRLLQRISIPHPEEYSGHSARRGGYVDRLAVPLHFVQVQGHWAPGSATTDRDYSVHSIPLRLQYF